MPIEDKEHYNAEEKKPLFIETKGFKYQVFKDSVRFLIEEASPSTTTLEISVKNTEFIHIMNNLEQYKKDGYYTGQCISCHKFDALVKGYCQPCFQKEGMEYDK